jgi:hypothetical protein
VLRCVAIMATPFVNDTAELLRHTELSTWHGWRVPSWAGAVAHIRCHDTTRSSKVVMWAIRKGVTWVPKLGKHPRIGTSRACETAHRGPCGTAACHRCSNRSISCVIGAAMPTCTACGQPCGQQHMTQRAFHTPSDSAPKR